jgi:hypothetical protein
MGDTVQISTLAKPTNNYGQRNDNYRKIVDADPIIAHRHQVKRRNCLCCGEPFQSSHFGNRLCSQHSSSDFNSLL